MVINIPINLDERIFEEKVQRDYDRILEKRLMETIERTLIESARYSYIRNPENGMRKLIEDHLDDFMKKHKDEIIAQAADILAKRVQRTKKAKEELDGKDNS